MTLAAPIFSYEHTQSHSKFHLRQTKAFLRSKTEAQESTSSNAVLSKHDSSTQLSSPQQWQCSALLLSELQPGKAAQQHQYRQRRLRSPNRPSRSHNCAECLLQQLQSDDAASPGKRRHSTLHAASLLAQPSASHRSENLFAKRLEW